MEKTGDGRMWVARVTLRPRVTFAGRMPDDAELDRLNADAHRLCFIANSVKTEIVVEASALAA